MVCRSTLQYGLKRVMDLRRTHVLIYDSPSNDKRRSCFEWFNTHLYYFL